MSPVATVLTAFILSCTVHLAHANEPLHTMRADYWAFIKIGELQSAKDLALVIDARTGHGDIFKAFTDAHVALKDGDCALAVKIADTIVRYQPGFLHAYDILAICKYKNGDVAAAKSIYQALADRLPEGPLKTSYEARVDTLRQDMSWKRYVSVQVNRSDNLNRRTSETTTSDGWTISDDSRAQAGYSGQVISNFSKKLKQSEDGFVEGILKAGLQYNQITEIYLPSMGGILKKTWLLDQNRYAYGAAGYNHTWSDNKTYMQDVDITIGNIQKLNQNTTFSLINELSWLDFQDDDRDSWEVRTSATFTQVFDTKNILTSNLSLYMNRADNDYYNIYQYSANSDWEHPFENGFITSIKGELGIKNYDRIAPLTGDQRLDRYYGISLGISHSKIQWSGLRPQLTYSATRNISNDVFNDYTSNDINLVIKKSF